MAKPTPKIPYAPETNTVRVVKINDAALPSTKKDGLNFADYDEVEVVVSFRNSGNAAVIEPHFWSEEAQAFLALETPVTLTAAAPGTRKIFRVARHESVFWEITGIAGGAATDERVVLEMSGIPKFNEVG